MFSEEDLARHLQIILRTHSELGYRQEQRFHLELGLLKMAHAQKLLPIEQLLSDAGISAPRSPGKPTMVPEARRPEVNSPAGSTFVSPFAADSARKSGTKSEMSADNAPGTGPRAVSGATPTPAVVMGSAAPAPAMSQPSIEPLADPEPVDDTEPQEPPDLRNAVLNALSGHRMLASMLETGEWSVQGNELVIKVSASPTIIEMSVGADARRIATATASGVLGRAMKFKVVAGGTAQASPPTTAGTNGGGRGRAEQDPVVRRMREKFGAEIRTIIDYKNRK